MSEHQKNTPPHPGAFFTTRWTLVVRAQGQAPEARVALGELCQAYWAPVFHFLRREGRDEDSSRELAQAFIERLLSSRNGIEGADPKKGRFRSYLLGALKHFLADLRLRESRLKRGGDAIMESIDAESDSPHAFESGAAASSVSDAYFDRKWAVALVERALESVRTEFEQAGKLEQFDAFKPWLIGEHNSPSQSDVASALGMSGGAAKVAIHRLREQFRKSVCREIRQTVTTPQEEAEELRYLIEVLSS